MMTIIKKYSFFLFIALLIVLIQGCYTSFGTLGEKEEYDAEYSGFEDAYYPQNQYYSVGTDTIEGNGMIIQNFQFYNSPSPWYNPYYSDWDWRFSLRFGYYSGYYGWYDPWVDWFWYNSYPAIVIVGLPWYWSPYYGYYHDPYWWWYHRGYYGDPVVRPAVPVQRRPWDTRQVRRADQQNERDPIDRSSTISNSSPLPTRGNRPASLPQGSSVDTRQDPSGTNHPTRVIHRNETTGDHRSSSPRSGREGVNTSSPRENSGSREIKRSSKEKGGRSVQKPSTRSSRSSGESRSNGTRQSSQPSGPIIHSRPAPAQPPSVQSVEPPKRESSSGNSGQSSSRSSTRRSR